jgi:hypothetical protein
MGREGMVIEVGDQNKVRSRDPVLGEVTGVPGINGSRLLQKRFCDAT